ncbi:YceI family protein [Pantoea sp. BS_4]|uniref:YceI family protein n=1 Tax=unclassified Pantoea TaxID=2630326 RepID=UPI0035C05C35
MTRAVSFLVAGVLLSPFAHAAPLYYTISTPDTAIGLSWRAFGGMSHAKLTGVTGEVTLNPENELDNHVRVTIPVSTLIASNNLLTYQLKSSMFFDAPRYPNIVFTSTRIVARGNGKYRLFGALAVKDVQRPVILDATMEEHDRTAETGDRISLHAMTTISRSAYHMDRFTSLVDDRVTITIDIQAEASHVP